MKNNLQKIEIKKMAAFLFKRIWIIIVCAAIGFAGLYIYTRDFKKDTYTAFATMYVINGNPNQKRHDALCGGHDVSAVITLIPVPLFRINLPAVLQNAYLTDVGLALAD